MNIDIITEVAQLIRNASTDEQARKILVENISSLLLSDEVKIVVDDNTDFYEKEQDEFYIDNSEKRKTIYIKEKSGNLEYERIITVNSSELEEIIKQGYVSHIECPKNHVFSKKRMLEAIKNINSD